MSAIEPLLADVSIAARVIAHRVRLPVMLAFEDLVQLGALGLLDAARRFDPDAGATLRTFARPRIHGAIRDGIRAAHPLTAGQRRELRTGGVFQLLPLEAAAHVPAPGASSDAALFLEQLLADLPWRERLVLDAYYLRDIPLRAIARVLGITPGHAAVIKFTALARLRKRVA